MLQSLSPRPPLSIVLLLKSLGVGYFAPERVTAEEQKISLSGFQVTRPSEREKARTLELKLAAFLLLTFEARGKHRLLSVLWVVWEKALEFVCVCVCVLQESVAGTAAGGGGGARKRQREEAVRTSCPSPKQPGGGGGGEALFRRADGPVAVVERGAVALARVCFFAGGGRPLRSRNERSECIRTCFFVALCFVSFRF